LELGTWNLELGTWNLVRHATWNLELGIWNLEPGTCPRLKPGTYRKREILSPVYFYRKKDFVFFAFHSRKTGTKVYFMMSQTSALNCTSTLMVTKLAVEVTERFRKMKSALTLLAKND
jgi:hypothetical protein